ncbi:DoxX family membrane protein [Azoarcus indigens]|uniref:Putative oxidoreductase n=1 Tax=Azoarcus indigens TaxID=29545 RepID=A0A4R6EGD8_9RHOO|nr:DoxX family protein [Azoarcus indigens]NMG66683.1 DoxX family membrane protein [Azoarcus indigens]TDN56873.1 putative oxidoreductase [Azoarcus indigens]
MRNPFDFSVPKESLVIPAMAGVYEKFAQPLGWLLLRLVVGGWLLHEGWPKILNPMGQVQFVEMIGFHPGWLFSPMLAIMQVVGGAALIVGFLTRPLALANAVMLFVTVWFHFHFPYNAEPLLSSAGLEAIKAHPEFLTLNGVKRLMDGGVVFTNLLQDKAVQLSSIWAFGCLFFAAFGGGIWSVDRLLKKSI